MCGATYDPSDFYRTSAEAPPFCANEATYFGKRQARGERRGSVADCAAFASLPVSDVSWGLEFGEACSLTEDFCFLMMFLL